MFSSIAKLTISLSHDNISPFQFTPDLTEEGLLPCAAIHASRGDAENGRPVQEGLVISIIVPLAKQGKSLSILDNDLTLVRENAYIHTLKEIIFKASIQ